MCPVPARARRDQYDSGLSSSATASSWSSCSTPTAASAASRGPKPWGRAAFFGCTIEELGGKCVDDLHAAIEALAANSFVPASRSIT
jgi:hypothetical protein